MLEKIQNANEIANASYGTTESVHKHNYDKYDEHKKML